MRELRVKSSVLCALLSLAASLASAQTLITPPKNKYTPAQDVQMGRDAAAQADTQLKILRDPQTTAYLERIGRRIIDAAPGNLQHPEFRYTFKVVDAKEINAFALPGGPTYFNRGMFIAARSEGEVAGVLAHELSHVLLRHGTAQATKATPYAIGSIAGQILGAVIGGRTGAIVSEGSQLGIGAAFLRFSREYEHDADILGAQLMARAGYDPREMANIFRTIEQQAGNGGAPEFLSSHPDPGDRYTYVMREADMLQVQNPVRDNGEFSNVRSRLGSNTLPVENPNSSASQAVGGPGANAGASIAAPSTRFRSFSVNSGFQVSVPENWQQLPGQNGATFAPANAFYDRGFSHGIEIGVAETNAASLRDATDQLVNSLAQGNPGLRSQGQRATTVDGRAGIETSLINQDQHGPEVVRVTTALSNSQTLLYAVTVVPQNEEPQYRNTFLQILRSLRISR